eukprot:scaffold75394_cov50-Phaeocystis_antarctica.AAC.2
MGRSCTSVASSPSYRPRWPSLASCRPRRAATASATWSSSRRCPSRPRRRASTPSIRSSTRAS